MSGSNAEIETNQLIHFWQVRHDEYGALFSLSTLTLVEQTIKKLQKLELLESRGVDVKLKVNG